MNRENIFDDEFCSKLKAFYSFDEGDKSRENIGYRRTGRTTILAKILIETAIESRKSITIQDHYVDSRGNNGNKHYMIRMLEQIAYEFKKKGIEIYLNFDRHRENFTAEIKSGFYEYQKLRYIPTNIKFVKQKEFLNKKILLLL